MKAKLEPESTSTPANGYLTESRRLRVDKPIFWRHHRGGWRHVVELIQERLHTPDGTRFISSVEDELFAKGEHYEGPFKEPWVGFIHQMPKQKLNFPDLERLFRTDDWKESISHCKGLWVLTDYQKNFLLANDVPVPVAKVLYPTTPPLETFSFARFQKNPRKRIICIGEFLRNYQDFYDLHSPTYEKTILKAGDVDHYLRKFNVVDNGSISSLTNVSDDAYDQLLAENLVFLSLFDAGAVTTVIECIASGTPLFINRVGGVGEYLGDDYPLYFETLAEAEGKIADLDLIEKAADFMRRHPLREKLTDAHFLEDLQATAVYRELPLPRSQAHQFKSYDVSLVICQYKRVYNLKDLLTRLSQQDFAGSYEVLIWNNNISAASEVSEICRPFEQQLGLKLIHSTENFYCQIRMAMASLIRSDLLLICDDDVLPEKNYISTFVNKYQEYGPEAVICARGHTFLPHQLNEEHPEQFWTDYESMRFHDESQPDRKIHFMHADNCLIPKRILKQALRFEMERYEYSLIDDYWLSYILSARLNIALWKIKADGALRMTECSDDPSIALFHNPLVNEQRVNFYIYHTRRGWPAIEENGRDAVKAVPATTTTPLVKPPKLSRFEELAVGLANREIRVGPSKRSLFFMQFAAAFVRHQMFFLTEDRVELETLLPEVEQLIATYKSLSLTHERMLDYLEEIRVYAASVKNEPPPEQLAWKQETLSEQTLAVPSMLFPDTRLYYKWLGKQLRGRGEVVELGCWLGSGTMSLAESLSANADCNGCQIQAYDSFKWSRWMARFLRADLKETFPELKAMKSGDDFLPLYLEFCRPYRNLIQAKRVYVRAPEDLAGGGPMAWDGKPIELLIYDLGQEYYLMEETWKTFSPSFISGTTMLVLNPFAKEDSGGLRRFVREHASQLKPIHKPASSTKTFLFLEDEGR